jgi:hypothetical protein
VKAIMCGGKPTESDIDEMWMFAKWIRLVAEAERAGVPRNEAASAVYEDVYAPDGKERGK